VSPVGRAYNVVTSRNVCSSSCSPQSLKPGAIATRPRRIFNPFAPTPPLRDEKIVLIFNVKNYAVIWILLKMYTWNVPLPSFAFQISKYATRGAEHCGITVALFCSADVRYSHSVRLCGAWSGDVLSLGDIGVSVSVPWVVSLVIDKPAPHCTTRRHPNIANLVSVYVIIQ